LFWKGIIAFHNFNRDPHDSSYYRSSSTQHKREHPTTTTTTLYAAQKSQWTVNEHSLKSYSRSYSPTNSSTVPTPWFGQKNNLTRYLLRPKQPTMEPQTRRRLPPRRRQHLQQIIIPYTFHHHHTANNTKNRVLVMMATTTTWHKAVNPAPTTINDTGGVGGFLRRGGEGEGLRMKPDRSHFLCVFALVATPATILVTFWILIRGDGRIREDREGKIWGEGPATGAATVLSFATSSRRPFERVDHLGLMLMLGASLLGHQLHQKTQSWHF
jgi:hypothetical protein